MTVPPKEGSKSSLVFLTNVDNSRCPKLECLRFRKRVKQRPKTCLGSRFHIQRPRNTDLLNGSHISVPPLTAREYKGTKRIDFNRRESMSNKKLIIFNFEGVIGDFYTPSVWNRESLSLYLRPNTLSVLEIICTKYQVALLFNSPAARAEYAVKHLCKAGIPIDGAYLVTQSPWSQLPFSYDQIYADFCISDKAASKVLVSALIHIE